MTQDEERLFEEEVWDYHITENTTEYEIAKHFYELGLNARGEYVMDTYEKKYKEALKRATKAKNNASLTKGTLRVLGIIFPELKKREDEKIRKELIDAFFSIEKYLIDQSFGDITISEAIERFKKQGEQKRNEETDDNA